MLKETNIYNPHSPREDPQDSGENPMEETSEYTYYDTEKYISAVFQSIVDHPIIRFLIFITVLLNWVIIGVQTDPTISKDYAAVFLVLERIIFVILSLEVFSKLIFCFQIFWMNGWNIADLLITLVLTAAYRFLPPSQKSAIKMLRLLRSVRLFSLVEGFSKVIKYITGSLPELIRVFLLIAGFTVIFGLIGFWAFDKHVPAFRTFPTALYTLFKCLIRNGWVSRFSDFKGKDPVIEILGFIYFFIYICICGFTFLNLFCSVITNQFAEDTESTKSEKGETPKKIDHVDEVMGKTSTTLHQTACYDSLMRNLTLENIEHLVLLRRAIAQNEQQQEELLQELQRIVEEVRNVPVNKERELQAQKERQIANTITDNLLTNEIASGQADMLSKLIALEEANVLDSRSTTSIFGEGAVQSGIRRLSRRILAESEANSEPSLESVICRP